MGLAACECGLDSAGEARGVLLSGGLVSTRPPRQLWNGAGSMRFSLGWTTTPEEIERAGRIILEEAAAVRERAVR